MPCYDPPPPWADAARVNAERAAKLLCGLVGKSLAAGGLPSIDLLEWYLGHRKVDLRMAQEPYYSNRIDHEEIERIKADIARVERLLTGAVP